jgi:formylglycine-generating enzyme required for sulfatase activity
MRRGLLKLGAPIAGALFCLLSLASSHEAASCRDPRSQVFVPAGSFWMGSDATERGLARSLSSPETIAANFFEAELPRAQAQTDAFCIDRMLVTQSRYAEFVAKTGHRLPGISRDHYMRQGFLVHDYDREVVPYLWGRRRPPRGKIEHPVVLVSAVDAEAYCRWRHRAARLPTEREWEKAARGTDGRIFPWGNSWDPARLNSAANGPLATTPVDLYAMAASPYGVLDAVGNVFQWTADILPGARRVLKGCAWDDDAGLCRPAARHDRLATSRHILIGFRCVEPVSDP